MSVLITDDRIKFGVQEASKIRTLSPDTIESVNNIRIHTRGMEQTPKDLAYQINQCTAPRSKSDVILILTNAFSDQPDFVSQTKDLVFPKVTSHETQPTPKRTRPLLMPLITFYRRTGTGK